MFTFSIPTTALFGAGKLNELHAQINTPMGAVHGKKALVVISSGKSTRVNGYLDRLESELKQAGVEYVAFDKVSANPTKPVVEEGGRFARENGCDFIVALGGGSVMDAAKAIGLMAANGGDLWDYVLFGSGKKQWPQKPGLPIVAIPTTAGTGSCTSAHPLEHALSAYHEKLPHGAGLIMISKAYYGHFVEQHACDDRFIEMAKLMGMEDADKPEDFLTALVELQKDCGVADLKMSDYGIDPSEFPKMVQNARDTLGPNFDNDPCPLSDEDCVSIYQKSYR